MNNALKKHIEDFGGKNGNLAFLIEKSGINEYILEQILLGNSDTLSDKDRTKINSFSSEEIIVRTSEQADWKGMVDVMPTIVCTKKELDKVLDDIKKQSFEEKIIQYSKNESSNYNPENLSISIAPYIPYVNFTLTEHPNQKGKILVDLYKNYETQSIDIFNDKIDKLGTPFFTENNEDIKKILEIIRRLRELGIYPENRSLQIEGGINFSNGKTNLYQVRDFSEIEFSNFELSENRTSKKSRVFGITPEKGLSFPISKGAFRGKAINEGDNKYPNGYICSPTTITDKLSVIEQPKSMKGYIPGKSCGSLSLHHQNTRFVKQVLNDKGFAILNPFYTGKEYDNGTILNIKSDGKNFEINEI